MAYEVRVRYRTQSIDASGVLYTFEAEPSVNHDEHFVTVEDSEQSVLLATGLVATIEVREKPSA